LARTENNGSALDWLATDGAPLYYCRWQNAVKFMLASSDFVADDALSDRPMHHAVPNAARRFLSRFRISGAAKRAEQRGQLA